MLSDLVWEYTSTYEPNWYNNFDDYKWNIITLNQLPHRNSITRYYRTKLYLWDDLSSLHNLRGTITFDSGIIIFVNGNEVLRKNINQGQTQDTYSTIVYIYYNYLFSIPMNILRLGYNYIGIEIHKSGESGGTDNFLFNLVSQFSDSNCVYKTLFRNQDPKMSVTNGNDNLFDMDVYSDYIYYFFGGQIQIQFYYPYLYSDVFNKYTYYTSHSCPNGDPKTWDVNIKYNDYWTTAHSITNDNQIVADQNGYPGQKRQKGFSYNFISSKSSEGYEFIIKDVRSQGHSVYSGCNNNCQMSDFIVEYCKPLMCPSDIDSPSAPIDITHYLPCPIGKKGYIEKICESIDGSPEWVRYGDDNCVKIADYITYDNTSNYLSFVRQQPMTYSPSLINGAGPTRYSLSGYLIHGITFDMITGIFTSYSDIEGPEQTVSIVAYYDYPNQDITMNLKIRVVADYCSGNDYPIAVIGEVSYKRCPINGEGYLHRLCKSNGGTPTWDAEISECVYNKPEFNYPESYFYIHFYNQSSPSITKNYATRYSYEGKIPDGIEFDTTTGVFSGILVNKATNDLIITACNVNNCTTYTPNFHFVTIQCPAIGDFKSVDSGYNSTRPCSDNINFVGTENRYCSTTKFPPTFDPIILNCVLSEPYTFSYISPVLIFHIGYPQTYRAFIESSALDSLEVTILNDDKFPDGVTLDKTTGEITGNPTMKESNYNFTKSYRIRAYITRPLEIYLTIFVYRPYCPKNGIYDIGFAGSKKSIDCWTGVNSYTISCPDKQFPVWKEEDLRQKCLENVNPTSISYSTYEYTFEKYSYSETVIPVVNGYTDQSTTYFSDPELLNGLEFSSNGQIKGYILDDIGTYLYNIKACNYGYCTRLNFKLTIHVQKSSCLANGLLPTSSVDTEYSNSPCFSKNNGLISAKCKAVNSNPIWSYVISSCLPSGFNYNNSDIYFSIGYKDKLVYSYDESSGRIVNIKLNFGGPELTLNSNQEIIYDGAGTPGTNSLLIEYYSNDNDFGLYFSEYKLRYPICLSETVDNITFNETNSGQIFEIPCSNSSGVIRRKCNTGKNPDWNEIEYLCTPSIFRYEDPANFYIGFSTEIIPEIMGIYTHFKVDEKTPLPDGLLLNETNGIIFGDPTTSGSYITTIYVYNTNEFSISTTVYIEINRPTCKAQIYNGVSYPEVPAGTVYYTSCPSGQINQLSRLCTYSLNPEWKQPDLSSCAFGCRSVGNWPDASIGSSLYLRCPVSQYGAIKRQCLETQLFSIPSYSNCIKLIPPTQKNGNTILTMIFTPNIYVITNSTIILDEKEYATLLVGLSLYFGIGDEYIWLIDDILTDQYIVYIDMNDNQIDTIRNKIYLFSNDTFYEYIKESTVNYNYSQIQFNNTNTFFVVKEKSKTGEYIGLSFAGVGVGIVFLLIVLAIFYFAGRSSSGNKKSSSSMASGEDDDFGSSTSKKPDTIVAPIGGSLTSDDSILSSTPAATRGSRGSRARGF